MPEIIRCFDANHTPVACGIDLVEDINRELERLTANDNFLNSVLEITRIGQALFACNAAVDTTIKVGEPVYYDVTVGRWRAASIDIIEVNGEITLSPKTQVMGIIAFHTAGAPTGTVLLQGIAEVNLLESTGFTTPSGLFFLTRSAGELSLTEDAVVSVSVLYAFGDGRVLFRPQWATTASLYRLRQFDLVVQSTGNFTIQSGRVTITGAGDPAKRGWLPITSTVFDGLDKPTGAKFGYNLPAHVEVNEIWPPIPLELAKIVWQPEGDGRHGAGEVSPELVVINSDGIWWMNDCTDQVPWTVTGNNSACGERISSFMKLYIPVNVPNSSGRVASLKSRSSSLKFYREGTNQIASTGALEAELNVNFVLGSVTTDENALAIKGFDNEGLLSRGPAVTYIKSLSPELEITGGSSLPDGRRFGNLEINLGGPQQRELLPQRIALDGSATDESYELSIAIGLPQRQFSGIRTQYYIPTLTNADFFLVQYEVWIEAAQAGVLPELKVSARAWQPPVSGPANSPTEQESLAFDVPATSLKSRQYLAVASAQFAVRSSSIVTLDLVRDGANNDRSSIQARILKQILRIVSPTEAEDPEVTPNTGIYAPQYANQYN